MSIEKEYTVNVWVGAEPYASITGEFDTPREVKAFAELFRKSPEYQDVTILVFRPTCMRGVDPRDL